MVSKYPSPDVGPPEGATTCYVCGIPMEPVSGTPVCEQHDTEITRKRFHLEQKLMGFGHQLTDVQQELSKFAGLDGKQDDQEYTRLTDKLTEVSRKRSEYQERLNTLQDECEHENGRLYEQEYKGEVVAERFTCPECGLEEVK